jgi:hypothetical protein
MDEDDKRRKKIKRGSKAERRKRKVEGEKR